jgi:hypothetical protein
MARKFFRTETVPASAPITARLGAQGGVYRDTEIGKLVKIGTLDSQMVLCTVGDFIEGYIVGVETATSDGFGIGSVQREDAKYVQFEGSQAAGTGAITLGQYVVAGTPAAQGTGLVGTYAKVRSATIQPGVTAAAAFADVATQMAMIPFLWRVVSLGTVGTGAVGTTGLIERVCS